MATKAFPSKSLKVECYYCNKLMLKQNLKTHTQSIHHGKAVREKVKGSAFDLFTMVRKNLDDEQDECEPKKARIELEPVENLDDNQNVSNDDDLNNSVEMNTETCDNKKIRNIINKNHDELMKVMGEVREKLDNFTEDEKRNEAGDIILKNDLIVESTRSVLEFCSLFPEFEYTSAKNLVKCKLCAPESIEMNDERITKEYFMKMKRPGLFFYEGSESFASDALLSRDFRNLKTNIKNHIARPHHQDKLNDKLKEAEEFMNSDSRLHKFLHLAMF